MRWASTTRDVWRRPEWSFEGGWGQADLLALLRERKDGEEV